MISIFDLEKLQALLKDFYQLSHIRITVFDENMEELVSYPDKVAPYCALIRKSAEGMKACKSCDQMACLAAAKKRKTHIYRCHAGLTEAVTPLFVGDLLVGYLLFGHVFTYSDHETGWTVIRDRCAGYGLNMNRLKELLDVCMIQEEGYVRSAAQILHAVASYLILEQMVTLKEELLGVRLDGYLRAHYTRQIKAEDLCDYLKIGKTQLYELSHKLYGCGIAGKIRSMRMEKAKALLLEQKNMPLSEVAFQCGFQDYNYFITVFSREEGLPPGAWKRKNQ